MRPKPFVPDNFFSVDVVVCDEGEMVENVIEMVAEAEAAKTLPAAATKGKEGQEHLAAPSASGGGLFDVILLGGGVGVDDAAEIVPDGKGPRGEQVDGGGGGRKREAEAEGRTPAERLDLVLDR